MVLESLLLLAFAVLFAWLAVAAVVLWARKADVVWFPEGCCWSFLFNFKLRSLLSGSTNALVVRSKFL